MSQLTTLTLRVMDPEAQTRFYCDVLGMTEKGQDRVGYSDREVEIQFSKASHPYKSQPSDVYWKIALSVPNIELAHQQLLKAGISCSVPNQFRDVGFLAKFTDPEGFTIELIDHWFQGDRPHVDYDETLLGGGAHLSLVTLRTGSIQTVEPDLLNAGMTALSVQSVVPFGFTLYFYAFTADVAPYSDLTAVENRPWLYQRPYTVLEVQHIHDLEVETLPAPGESGYVQLSARSGKLGDISRRLNVFFQNLG